MIAPGPLAYVFWSVVLVVCGSLDAMFCGLETGIYKINKIRLDLRAEAGQPGARTLQRMGQNFNNVLSVLLIGTNLCRFVATFAISAMFVMGGAGSNAQWLTMAVATPMMFVLQDSVPKSVFQRIAETMVYRLTWLLRWASVIFNACGLAPLVRLFATGMLRLSGQAGAARHLLGHTGVEAAVAEGRASGVLTDFQSDMADRAMRAGEMPLADAMVPLADVVTVPRQAGRDDILKIIADHDFARLPMCSEAGQIAGVLTAYDVLIDESADPAHLIAPPLVLAGDRSITDALMDFQRGNVMMAVVADPGGKHIGVVTIEDIVVQIVGQ